MRTLCPSGSMMEVWFGLGPMALVECERKADTQRSLPFNPAGCPIRGHKSSLRCRESVTVWLLSLTDSTNSNTTAIPQRRQSGNVSALQNCLVGCSVPEVEHVVNAPTLNFAPAIRRMVTAPLKVGCDVNHGRREGNVTSVPNFEQLRGFTTWQEPHPPARRVSEYLFKVWTRCGYTDGNKLFCGNVRAPRLRASTSLVSHSPQIRLPEPWLLF